MLFLSQGGTACAVFSQDPPLVTDFRLAREGFCSLVIEEQAYQATDSRHAVMPVSVLKISVP